MKANVAFKHEFVELIPDKLSDGVLYISIPFATASHKCSCGCGKEVVTPFSPTDWQLIFDGQSISLHPSIGNWSFPCQSHYWIRNGIAVWAQQWSHEQIKAGRVHDWLNKQNYYQQTKTKSIAIHEEAPSKEGWSNVIKSFWKKLTNF